MEVAETAGKERSSRPDAGQFYYWKNPGPEDIGDSALEWLHKLPGPTHLHLRGADSSRCRAVATLLHGNEPSGFHAVFNLIKQQVQPAVDIHIFIPSVYAARQGPGFIYRMLPQHKDLNRCFQPPYDDSDQDKLAQALLNKLKTLDPECVIDVHNTSGSSPSFGVTTFMDGHHDALVSLFTHRMIVTDLRLGALMEISDTMMPTVTIECGGARDKDSNQMATEGLKRYMTLDNVLNHSHGTMTLEFYHNPIRVELKERGAIAFGDYNLLENGVTLLPDIEQFNFGFAGPEDSLGFISGGLSENLTAIDFEGRECIEQYFELRGEELYPRQTIKLFMVTTNPEIARRDCLFYIVEAD